jgi:molybdate transport system substrate-binding protein
MPGAPLKLLSSMATRELLAELAELYRRRTGGALSTEAAGGVDVAKRVKLGEAVDVVVLASNAIDALIADERCLAGSRVDLVASGVAVAVRAGAAVPDVSSEEAVRRAVATAASISYSTGPSGVYLEKLFARWGLLESLRERITVASPGVPVGSLVANGAVELGFQQHSELKNLAGISVAGLLPAAIQTTTIFSGAVASACEQPDAARKLLEFLAAPALAPIKQRHGMDAV